MMSWFIKRSVHTHVFLENIEENDLGPDEGNQMLCKACGLPIFSTPFSYKNNFPLHKDCANLPTELKGHFLHPAKPLFLLEESLPHDDQNKKCCHYHNQCKGFINHCPDCKFVLDVLFAVPIGTIKVLHRSHQHELVPITAKTLVTYGACESDHHGPSYLCNVCNFWIHWDCALLPSKIQHKNHDSDQHILALTYSLTKTFECSICQRRIMRGNYFCARCEYSVHIKCATSIPNSYIIVSKGHIGDNGLIHLPMVDEQTSLVRYFLENTTSKSSEKLFEGNHGHPLKYHDHTSIKDDDHKHRLCNGCVRPISLPFYRCPQCIDFVLHSCCANLPCKFQSRVFRNQQTLDLHLKSGNHFFSTFRCNVGSRYCNGFFYTKD